jgi:hypothetical protein
MILVVPRSYRAAALALLAPLLLLALGSAAPAKDDPEGAEALSYRPGVPTAGNVVALGASNFRAALEDPANPIWLLKFYAPWYERSEHEKGGNFSERSTMRSLPSLSLLLLAVFPPNLSLHRLS